MRFQTIAYVVALASGLASGIVFPEVPFEGFWSVTEKADGTIISTSFSNPDFPPIVSRSTSTSNTAPITRNVHGPRWVWPDGDCWPYELNHAQVDDAANTFASRVGAGYEFCATDTTSLSYLYVNSGQTMVYYCLTEYNVCGNIDNVDVRYALGQMDTHCKPYQASWFRWPGSHEIFGKANLGDRVCV